MVPYLSITVLNICLSELFLPPENQGPDVFYPQYFPSAYFYSNTYPKPLSSLPTEKLFP